MKKKISGFFTVLYSWSMVENCQNSFQNFLTQRLTVPPAVEDATDWAVKNSSQEQKTEYYSFQKCTVLFSAHTTYSSPFSRSTAETFYKKKTAESHKVSSTTCGCAFYCSFAPQATKTDDTDDDDDFEGCRNQGEGRSKHGLSWAKSLFTKVHNIGLRREIPWSRPTWDFLNVVGLGLHEGRPHCWRLAWWTKSGFCM